MRVPASGLTYLRKTDNVLLVTFDNEGFETAVLSAARTRLDSFRR